MRRRGVVVLATVGLFAAGIVGFSHVQQQFFPISERPELFIELRMPAGTAIGATDAATRQAEALLKGDPDIATYTSYVGEGSPRFWLGLSPQQPDSAFAQIVILSKDVEARERIKARLTNAIADGAIPAARVRLNRFDFGPPVGFPVQFRVIGPDPLEVRQIAYRVRDVVERDQDAVDPQPRLERAHALRPPGGRSGSRAGAGADAGGHLAGTADAALRRHRHHDPRRHRGHRRGRARGAERTARPRTASPT